MAVSIDAPRSVVWKHLADLGSHAEWMADAESIEFRSRARRGIGAVMEVATRVGPLRTTDVIEVTGWTEGESIEVAHRGLVSGRGRFDLDAMAGGTRFTWSERLTFPWWLGGPVTALLATPILTWIWRRNLLQLRLRVEREGL
ncbi:MAG: SRPBCC family protein [Acidimicrobiia bacterium]